MFIHSTVPGIKRQSNNPALKLTMSLAQMRSFSADVTIYIMAQRQQARIEDDVDAGIVTTGDPTDLNIIGELVRLGRKFTSSYSGGGNLQSESFYSGLPPMIMNLPDSLSSAESLKFCALLTSVYISRHFTASSQRWQPSQVTYTCSGYLAIAKFR